jgi:hypothetical protein
MSRKKCRRKHYRLVNPIEMAIFGAAVTDKSIVDHIRLRNLSAIDAFAKGVATPDDWRTVADYLNVAETMAKGGIGPEVLEPCQAVQEALGEAHRRYKECGRLGLSGPEIQALRELHEFHDLQIQSVTRGEFEQWIERTANRIRSAHPDRTVVI